MNKYSVWWDDGEVAILVKENLSYDEAFKLFSEQASQYKGTDGRHYGLTI